MIRRLLLPPAAALLLLAGLGCDGLLVPRRPSVYAAWEEGLTLGYERPGSTGEARLQSRIQVRVKSSRPGPEGLAVVQTHATLSSSGELPLLLSNGGEYLGTARSGIPVLPEGFPDRVSRWTARGTFFQVVGRGTFRLPGNLPSDEADVVGVWVQSEPLDGRGEPVRILYLPDIGEAEAQRFEAGRWTPMLRLVSRGFTDVPRDRSPGQ